MNTTAVVWIAMGVLFMLAELALPGFVIFFFGLGAILTGILSLAGIIDGLFLQLVVFIIISLGSMFVFRKRWGSYFKGKVSGKISSDEEFENIQGIKVKVMNTIIPGKIGGKVELNGTIWEADSEEVIEAGEIAEIISRSNLKLNVKKH